MNNIDKIIKSAITSVLSLSVIGNLVNPSAAMAAAEPKTEKCYGIVKAGMNDCPTVNGSCAGSAVKDNQADAFILLPKGVCNRIVGGSLTPKTDPNKKQ